MFSWDNAKILWTGCFWYIGSVWLCAPKVILSSCINLLGLSTGKKSTSSPMLLWRYCKNMQTYFGYFGHAWLHSPKVIVSPCRRPRCLSACQNPILGLFRAFFAQIWAKIHFSGKKWLCQFFNIQIICYYAKNHLCLMSHSWENFWMKTTKTSLSFSKNLALSCTTPHGPLTPSWVPKKTKEPIPRKLPKRRTDRPYSYDPSGQLRGIAVDNKNKIQYNSAWDTSLT